MRVGAAVADITPGLGVAMGGYGARVGVASGQRDPLLVRTIVLTDDRGEVELSVSVCDLVGVSYPMVREARRILSDEAGLAPERVLVAATHTHSGPAGVRATDAADYVSVTARKIAGSVLAARSSARACAVKLGRVEVGSISANRRSPDAPRETAARVLVADGVATLVNFACHATVFEHDNLDWSADFPGAMCRFVERELGGVALYLQGAAGDINPVWMRHDAAEVDRVGSVLGAAVVRLAHEMAPVDPGGAARQWVINLNWSEEVPVSPAVTAVSLGDGPLAAAVRTVVLQRRSLPAVEELRVTLEDLRAARSSASSVDERRTLTARINALEIEERMAADGEPRRQSEPVELQAFKLGSRVGLVSLPGEFFVSLGEEIRSGCADVCDELLIAGYANGLIGYVPAEDAFASHGYEVGMARFVPSAASTLVSEAIALVHEVMA